MNSVEILDHGTRVHTAQGAGFGTDALLLARFATPKLRERALDLCSGCGILALAGIACVGLVLGWSYLVAAGCCLGAVVLAIVGLCGCRRISNKYGRVGSIMLFAFAAAAALLFGIIVVAIGMR